MSVNFLLRLLMIALCLLSGASLSAQTTDTREADAPRTDSISPAQRLIAAAALDLVGQTRLEMDGKKFPWDCSGTVLGSLWKAGLDVTGEYGSFDGNGVNRLHEIAVVHELDYDLLLPEIGDIIFWDNTYDRNGDLKWNDPLTHTGVVVGVDSNGTISYVHHDYRRGIVVAHMNLLYPLSQFAILPDGTRTEINSPLRMNSDRYLNPTRWLSSHLFRSFGRIHVLLDRQLTASVNTGAPANPASKS